MQGKEIKERRGMEEKEEMQSVGGMQHNMKGLAGA